MAAACIQTPFLRSALGICLLVFLVPPASAGETWPEFRGPTRDGQSDATGLPLRWSETDNITWKTRIHDRGWSSPVIWQNQVWVTTATRDGHRLYAVGLDRTSGQTIHDVQVFDVERPEPIAAINSYASPTSAIEAGRVYVHYGTYGTACLDTANGQILWTRRDLNCDHHEGPGGSLMLFEDLLIFHVDGRDVQYVVALDKRTGATVWRTDRSIDFSPYNPNFRKAFCTPIIVPRGGQPQLICPGAKAVMGYDPRTGEELWKLRYRGWSVTPRPLWGHELLFLITDYVRPELWAVRLGGRGDLSESHVVWQVRRGAAKTPSLLLVGELLYMVSDGGVVSCLEATTGDMVWQQRLQGDYSASPVHAGGRIYLLSHDALATVISTGRHSKPIAVNQLDGQLRATPAVAGNALFVRTETHLYRIED